MKRKRVTLALCCAFVIGAAGLAKAAVVTVYPGTRITAPGVEPAEWQLNDGWSIVTNRFGVGAIRATGPSVCETPYSPFKAYNLTNIAASSLFPRWQITQPPTVKQDMGRGAFYASCDRRGAAGVTPSSVWIGTDRHGGRSLVGVKLNQITKMKYYALVTGVPTWLAPGSSDAGWDSWKQAWYNPRFPIMLTLTVEGPAGRRQLWFRPWGDHSTIGDQASDGRLNIWEQYDCMRAPGASTSGSGGFWFCPGEREYDCPTQFNGWAAVLAVYGDYTLVATSTGFDPGNGQWKSPGYTDTDETYPTDPPGRPACTGTGKCLNFWVGARYYQLLRPDECSYKTWHPESMRFRGQMDWFEFAVNYGTTQNPNVVDVTYNFEPAPDDPGPKFVYLTNMSALRDANNADTLIEKMGEPADPYDPVQNPLKNNREERLYDVIFKVAGKVSYRVNAYSELNDGANVSPPTRVYMVLENPRPSYSGVNPTNPMGAGQYWSSWGLLERFRPTGSGTPVLKPFIVWTPKTHNQKLWP